VNSRLKLYFKYLIFLFLFTIAFFAIGFFIVNILHTIFTLGNVIFLVLTFSAISFTTLLIFFTGQLKVTETQPVYTLLSIGLKFILEAILALIWFVVAKNLHTQYVLLFFVLYLAFTIFSVLIILNVLNNKAL
jgi:hypothetical protein